MFSTPLALLALIEVLLLSRWGMNVMMIHGRGCLDFELVQDHCKHEDYPLVEKCGDQSRPVEVEEKLVLEGTLGGTDDTGYHIFPLRTS